MQSSFTKLLPGTLAQLQDLLTRLIFDDLLLMEFTGYSVVLVQIFCKSEV